MLKLRRAELGDVPALFEMINHYAAQGIMLRRTLTELYECVREFLVAEEDGKVVGCGALKFYAADLAEIRSLCVAPGLESRGLGRALTEPLLELCHAMSGILSPSKWAVANGDQSTDGHDDPDGIATRAEGKTRKPSGPLIQTPRATPISMTGRLPEK